MLRPIVGSIILIFSTFSLYAADKCAINAYEATYSLSLSHGKPIGSIKKSTNIEDCKDNSGLCYHISSELNAHKFIFTEKIIEDSYGRIQGQKIISEKYTHTKSGADKVLDLKSGHFDKLSYLLSLQKDLILKEVKDNYVVNTVNGVKFISVIENNKKGDEKAGEHLDQVNFHDTKGDFGSLWYKKIKDNHVMTKAILHNAKGHVYTVKLLKYTPNPDKCVIK